MYCFIVIRERLLIHLGLVYRFELVMEMKSATQHCELQSSLGKNVLILALSIPATEL